jgi:hypothetical protein
MSLYGLKQSPRAWFGRFTYMVTEYGMRRTSSDHSLFYRHSDAGCIILVVYVDDIVITGSDSAGITGLRKFLQSKFQTKDLGRLNYFLGIEVARSKKGIYISQRKYTLDLINDTKMTNAKPYDSLMIPRLKLMPDQGEPFDKPDRYRRLVGKLLYLTLTRPDISFVVGVVSQFMVAPRQPHWDAALRIVRYLKKFPGQGILYNSHGHTDIEGYYDAD